MSTGACRAITVEGDARQSVIISGEGNVVVFSLAPETISPDRSQRIPLEPNPYQGLAAFTEHSADRFFGRKSLTEQLWEKLRYLCEAPPGHPGPVRLLPIIGSSGCGKSSVARAGLVPELARRPLPGWSEAQIAVFTPGAHPIEALARVLAKRVTADPAPAQKAREFANELQRSTSQGGLDGLDGLRRIADLLPEIERRPLIVLVDQFEETYALCSELGERRRFVATLLDAASDPSARVSVILTLRSDFLGATNRYPELSQLIAKNAVLVPVLSEDELRQAIAEPAALAGQPLDPSTINLLIEQAADRDGALPLLQFALTQVWDGIGKGVAPAQTLDELGGVGGALAQEAQRLYERLEDADKPIARRALIAMVQLGEGAQDTRRRVPVSDIVAYGEAGEHVLEVLRAFSQPTRRLVTLSGEPGGPTAVELTHEALLEQWSQLRDWLTESREAIRFHRRLAEAAAAWDQQGRPEGSLWRTPDLDALRRFHDRSGADMTATEIDFFEASEQAKVAQARIERRKRGTLRITLFSVTVLLVCAVLAWNEARLAEKRAQARQFAAEASLLVARGKGNDTLQQAATLAIESWRRMNNPEAYATAEKLLAWLPETEFDHSHFPEDWSMHQSVRLSPNGQYVASTNGGKLVVLETKTGKRTISAEKPCDGLPPWVVFGADSQWVAADWGCSVRLYETVTGMELLFAEEGEFLQHGHDYQIAGGWGYRRALATVNPNGRWMALTSKDGIVLVDTRSGKRRRFIEQGVSGRSLMLSPKGKFLAIWGEDSIKLFQVPSGEQRADISLSGRFHKSARFDSDEHFFAFLTCKDFRCTEGNTLHIVNTTSGIEVNTIHLTNDLYRFSERGEFIVEYADNTARIFQSATGKQAFRIQLDAPIKDVYFAEQGLWLVLVTEGETAAVIAMGTGRELSRLNWTCASESIEHNELARVLVAICEDGRVQTFEIPSGRKLAEFKPQKSVYPTGTYSPLSPDGRFLIAGEMYTLQILETKSGRELANFDYRSPIFRAPGFGSPFGYPFSDDSRRMVFPDAFFGLRVVDTSGPLSVVHREFTPDEAPVFSSDARLLATPSPVGFIRVSAVESGETVALIRHDAAAIPVVFSADGSKIITASENTLQLFDLANRKTIATLEYKEGSRGYSRSLSADVQFMVWRADGANHLIRVDSLEEIGQVPGEEYGDVFEFDPEEELLAAIDAKHGNVRLYNTRDGKHRTLFELNARVYHVAFSPDGHNLAVQVSDDASEASTRLLDIRTGRERARLPHRKSLGPIEFSPDGLALAVLTTAVWLFDTTQGREISRVESRLFQFCSNASGRLPWLSAAFSADSRLFAVGAKSVRILDTSTGKERARIEFDAGCKGVIFSPDGKYLAAASDRGLVRLLSTETFEELAHVRHAAAVTDLRFSPDNDNRLLATSSTDGAVRLIDTHLERGIARFEHGNAVESIEFTDNGRWVITQTEPEKDDGKTSTHLLWSDPDWPFQQLCAKAGRNLSRDELKTLFGDVEVRESTCQEWR